MGSHLLKVMAPHFYCKNGEKESGKTCTDLPLHERVARVTRRCSTRYTNV